LAAWRSRRIGFLFLRSASGREPAVLLRSPSPSFPAGRGSMKRAASPKCSPEHRRQRVPMSRSVLTPVDASTARAASQEFPSPLSEHRRQHNPIPRNVLTPVGASTARAVSQKCSPEPLSERRRQHSPIPRNVLTLAAGLRCGLQTGVGHPRAAWPSGGPK